MKKMASSISPSMDKPSILSMISRHNPLATPSILLQQYLKKTHTTIDTVPSIYSGYFFRKDIITQFYTDLITSSPAFSSSGPLSIFKFYNKDDIINNLVYNPAKEETRQKSRQLKKPTIKLENNLKSVLKRLKKLCLDIRVGYINKSFGNTIKIPENITESKFDILVLSTNIIEDITQNFDARISGIVAFIIVELGECQKFPKAFSINLICSKEPGTGSLLMSAYLYTILSHPIDTIPDINPIELTRMGINGVGFEKVVKIKSTDGSDIFSSTFGSDEVLIPIQHIAVLELASAYGNPGGLCMYEKFGFKYDPTMFSDSRVNCFTDRNNLPMKIDFTNDPILNRLKIGEKKKLILDITTGIVKNVFTKSPICNLRGQEQELLGYLKSFELFITQKGYDIKLFEIGIDLLNTELLKLSPSDISDLINYLESKVTSSGSIDPSKESFITYLGSFLPPPPSSSSSSSSSAKLPSAPAPAPSSSYPGKLPPAPAPSSSSSSSSASAPQLRTQTRSQKRPLSQAPDINPSAPSARRSARLNP